LERAATAELVVFTDQQEFTTDLALLQELEPDVRFALGERPLRPDTVFVSIGSGGELFLATQDEGSTGLYLRVSRRPGEPTERAVATDPACRDAEHLDYRVIA
jgi:hypothetical protein